MTNRRTGSDDARGLDKPLNVSEQISSTYYVQILKSSKSSNYRLA